MDAPPLPSEARQAERPGQTEIKKFAKDAFGVVIKKLSRDQAKKKQQVLYLVSTTHNSGGYLPALTEWAVECLREGVLALADCYAEAFTLFNRPAEPWAEQILELTTREIEGGLYSNVIGELDLLRGRTGMPLGNGAGHINREIAAASSSALAEAKLRLQRQRIVVRYSRPLASARREAETIKAPPASRKRLNPNPSILPKYGTVNKKVAANALGVTPRTVERMTHLTPVKKAAGNHYQVSDIRAILVARGVRQAPTKNRDKTPTNRRKTL